MAADTRRMEGEWRADDQVVEIPLSPRTAHGIDRYVAWFVPADRPRVEPKLKRTMWWLLVLELAWGFIFALAIPQGIPVPPQPNCDNAWCQINDFDVAWNKAFIGPNPAVAGEISHVICMGICALMGFFCCFWPLYSKADYRHIIEDAFIMCSAVALAYGGSNIAKATAVRQRPAWHFNREQYTEAADRPGEQWMSFYSGDSTLGFSFIAASFSLSLLRKRSYLRWYGLVGFTLATIGAILRMVGDMHWATDVLAGSATGILIGLLYPYVLHQVDSDDALC